MDSNQVRQSNQQYVAAAQEGSIEAFEMLVKLNSSYIYNLAYNLSAGNRADADDLAQATFIRAFRAIKNFEGRSNFKTWLHRITVNLWKNTVRSQKRRKYFQHQSINEVPKNDQDGPQLVLKETRLNPLEKTEQNETSVIVRQAIEKLPRDEREVLVLRDLEGYAYDEIATICNIPLGTVKSRLSRARKMLKAELEPILRRT